MLLFKLVLHTARGLSILGSMIVLSYGFWLPLSLNQALFINPLILLTLISISFYCGYRLNNLPKTTKTQPQNITFSLDDQRHGRSMNNLLKPLFPNHR